MSNEHNDDEIRERDKATAMLAEVTRERDELLAERARVAETLAGLDAETVDDLARTYLRLLGASGSEAARMGRSLSDTAAERDALRVALDSERVRSDGDLAEVIRERDELRARLERARGLKRWKVAIQEERTGPAWDTAPGSDIGVRRYVVGEPHEQGYYVIWADIAAIVGKDGE